jgi:MORN repeat variant protein
MKKILLILLSFSAILLLTACGEIKYELKDGTMYANGKETTGTFEFILNGYKTKGKYINGLPDGLFERYYPDGSIFIKEEIFYKSGETLATATDGKYLKLFDKDGRLVESYDADKDKNIIYHENGKPLIITIGRDSTIYNENSEILSKEENGKIVDLDMIIKNVGNGLSEIIMDDKVIAKMNNNTGVLTYFYSTGEPMITTNSSTAETQFFFKNGNIFFKSNGKEFILYHKDGKPIHELNEGITKYYNEDGDEILMNSYKVEDIKKID